MRFVNPELSDDPRTACPTGEKLAPPLPSPSPDSSTLPELPQHIARVVFVDPEGIIAFGNDNQLVGSSSSNLTQFRRLQVALGKNSRFVLCLSEGVRVNLGEEQFLRVFRQHNIRVDGVVEPREVDISRMHTAGADGGRVGTVKDASDGVKKCPVDYCSVDKLCFLL